VVNNQAIGGIGAAAQGGGVANVHGGVVHIADSTLADNLAQGGAGGSGLGGGVYNGPASTHPLNTGAESALVVQDSHLVHNVAQGGDGGEGIGGGVYNLGLFDLDDTLIFGNLASTSDNDVFSL
jgi:hypothetical protein